MSQAQSISNLCHQRARELDNRLSNINNCSRTVNINGETYVETEKHPIPENVRDILLEKAKLHATQAFLMENINAKEQLLHLLKAKQYDFAAPPVVDRSQYLEPELLDQVHESWGWEQLSAAEMAEFLEVEAYAAHLGQFIHSGGPLDKLRKELPKIQTLQFIEIEAGKRTPMRVTVHHTPEKLLDIHESIASQHRQFEQRVNYFKAKVHNLVTEENARRAKHNGDEHARVNEHNKNLDDAFQAQMQQWRAKEKEAHMEFEAQRAKETQETAGLRIQIDPRFQDIIDMFLKQLED